MQSLNVYRARARRVKVVPSFPHDRFNSVRLSIVVRSVSQKKKFAPIWPISPRAPPRIRNGAAAAGAAPIRQMFILPHIVLVAAAFVISSVECSGVAAVPAVAAAPVVEYAHAVPDNIPPYAAQINVFRKALSPLIAAPAVAPWAAPLAARVAHFAPAAAPFAAPLAAPTAFAPAPYLAGPAPIVPGPGVPVPAAYAALAAPAPYAWPAPYAAAAPAPYAPFSPYVAPAPFAAAPALVR
ncbi:hypothetical protein EVAR_28320_1 [Eumeta japonica]|uniref:Uncharacterized protein n=1 Tax=Eumeta variegata TaxID=151549 RepID=A0A4C1V8C7_EUMVA|nr:hypothetical protein EVAR_28320_1 [Eumeta japonica]